MYCIIFYEECKKEYCTLDGTEIHGKGLILVLKVYVYTYCTGSSRPVPEKSNATSRAQFALHIPAISSYLHGKANLLRCGSIRNGI